MCCPASLQILKILLLLHKCRATETLAYKHCTCTAKTSKDRSLKRSFEAPKAPKAPFEAFRLAFDRPKRLWKSVSAVASRLALFAIKVGGEGALKLHRVHVWDVLSRSFMRFTDTDFLGPSQPATTTITSTTVICTNWYWSTCCSKKSDTISHSCPGDCQSRHSRETSCQGARTHIHHIQIPLNTWHQQQQQSCVVDKYHKHPQTSGQCITVTLAALSKSLGATWVTPASSTRWQNSSSHCTWPHRIHRRDFIWIALIWECFYLRKVLVVIICYYRSLRFLEIPWVFEYFECPQSKRHRNPSKSMCWSSKRHSQDPFERGVGSLEWPYPMISFCRASCWKRQWTQNSVSSVLFVSFCCGTQKYCLGMGHTWKSNLDPWSTLNLHDDCMNQVSVRPQTEATTPWVVARHSCRESPAFQKKSAQRP